MNRPNLDDEKYKMVFREEPGEYLDDLEEYCTELESNCNLLGNQNFELRRKLESIKNQLNKIKEILNKEDVYGYLEFEIAKYPTLKDWLNEGEKNENRDEV